MKNPSAIQLIEEKNAIAMVSKELSSSSSRVRATANDSACVQTTPNNDNALSSRVQSTPNISMSTTRLDETLKPVPLRPKSSKAVPEKDSSNHLGRPLKLIYGHDIRLARMPIKSTFSDLREIVRKRFPSSKAVLIKYKDADGDLITITCSEELRLAELASFTEADGLKSKVESIESKQRDSDTIFVDPMPLLRLHVVEVDPEQEPVIEEEQEQEQEEEQEEQEAKEEQEELEEEEDILFQEIDNDDNDEIFIPLPPLDLRDLLDTCLTATDMQLVGRTYSFLRLRGLLPNFGRYRNISECFSSSF